MVMYDGSMTTSTAKAPKNGTTDHCAHEGCTMVLRFKNGTWLHSIRQSYDHSPLPVNHEPATAPAPLDGFAAMAAIDAMILAAK